MEPCGSSGFGSGPDQDTRASLAAFDRRHPPAVTAGILERPENAHLLGAISSDAFTHLFPGGRPSSEDELCGDLESELLDAPVYHLWVNVPLCRYRCAFCQFPVLLIGRSGNEAHAKARLWVDALIAEARLWFERVPSLMATPVGEFCLFGGTPTALPHDELQRLVGFFADHLSLTPDRSWRAEGSPDTLTEPALRQLRDLGFSALVYGIQTFDDAGLRRAGRRHTGAQAAEVIKAGRRAGFERVDGDLIYGLPGQSVDAFASDVGRAVDLGFDTIAVMKLHLASFVEADTAIGNVHAASWQDPARRDHIAASGYRWPTLGEQLQMREQADVTLRSHGYVEHPATYFVRRSRGPARWRQLNLDQDHQYPQLGIGLGGYAWSSRSSATQTADPDEYLRRVRAGRLPLGAITGSDADGREARAVRMALTTCQPLVDEVHRARFDGHSLFDAPWSAVFAGLERRGLVTTDPAAGVIALTMPGRTLVEAIVNTELRR